MRVYGGIATKLNHLQSPFPLAIRLYRGRQFAQTGWGKMHNIAKIAGFFASLNIPFPAFSTHFISGLEFFGGLLLILGMASRLTGFFLAANMLVAKMVLILGALALSADRLIVRKFTVWVRP